MATLCDVNCLLAFCYDRHVHHPDAITWLEAQDGLSVVICRNTQLGLLRLLMNASVMGKDVCNLKQAWTIYDTLMGDESLTFPPSPWIWSNTCAGMPPVDGFLPNYGRMRIWPPLPVQPNYI